MPCLRLVPVTPHQLTRFAAGEPVPVTPGALVEWPHDDRRVLTYRLQALEAAPRAWNFLLHAALTADGAFVGRIGCHGGPDEGGEVEIGYYVVPAWRGRGVAGQMLDTFLYWLADQGVRGVKASVGPDNGASLRLLERRGFRHVGVQWDDEDGLELVYRRELS